jgi:hypothetical protein
MASLDELEWRSPEWINVYGLRTDNVLEYFSLSPFWDRQCNNQVLKMQRQFQFNSNGNNGNGNGNGEFPVAVTIPTFDAELRRLRGIEYVLHMVREPDLWIIRKEKRWGDGSTAYKASPPPGMSLEQFVGGGPGLDAVDDVDVLATFFIVGSKVYMGARVGDVVGAGVLSVEQLISSALDLVGNLNSNGGPSQEKKNTEDDDFYVDRRRLFAIAAREREQKKRIGEEEGRV